MTHKSPLTVDPKLSPSEQRMQDVGQDVPFFTRQPALLLIYMVFSMGSYALYWMYRNWDAVRAASGKRMWPIMRALFAIIYVWPLFKIMVLQAHKRGYENKWLSGGLLALVYVLPTVTVSLVRYTHTYNNTDVMLTIGIAIISTFVLLAAQHVAIYRSPSKVDAMYSATSRTELFFIAIVCVLPLWISLAGK
jgi:hypothetical protein